MLGVGNRAHGDFAEATIAQCDFEQDRFLRDAIRRHVEAALAEAVGNDLALVELDRLHEMRMVPNHEVGAGVDRGVRKLDLVGDEVLVTHAHAPVPRHDHGVGLAARARDVAAGALELLGIGPGVEVERRARHFVQALGDAIAGVDPHHCHARPVGRGLKTRREHGGEREERVAAAVPFDHRRPVRRGERGAGAAVGDAGGIEHLHGLQQPFGAVVHDMVVGEAHHVEAAHRIGAHQIGPRAHHPAGLARPGRAAVGQRPFAIAERDRGLLEIGRDLSHDAGRIGSLDRNVAGEREPRKRRLLVRHDCLRELIIVVPAKAGTHRATHGGLWNMGPRLRGDDTIVFRAMNEHALISPHRLLTNTSRNSSPHFSKSSTKVGRWVK